jgi:RNA processing factor Prp31
MREIPALFFFVACTVFCAISATADVGVTDRCQEEVRELEDKIRDNKDDYTAESRRKAQAQLAAAKTNRANPAKCRENLRDSRQELRDGKT